MKRKLSFKAIEENEIQNNDIISLIYNEKKFNIIKYYWILKTIIKKQSLLLTKTLSFFPFIEIFLFF